MQPSQSHRGIVNGHWEPSERSNLLELVRETVAKLTKKASPAAAHTNLESERDQPIAAE